MRIVLCYPVEKRHIGQIAAVAPEATIVDAGQEGIPTELLEADVFCGHAKVPVPWEEVVRKRRLQWIQSSAAGTDHCLVPSVIDSAIPVTSASGVLANQVAEQTLALLLGLLRRLPAFFRAQMAKEFIRRPTGDLQNTTVGIVGLGGNGRRLADVLRAFRAKILATDWFPVDKPSSVEQLLPADALEKMLPQVQSLILTAPLNQHTRGMINSRTLGLLPPGALVINVARGPLIVEQDLVTALRSGQIGGAGLDVLETEPPPLSSALWRMPNVLITPHVGGQAVSRIDDMTDFFCKNLKCFLEGRPLMNLVNKELGFPEPRKLNS